MPQWTCGFGCSHHCSERSFAVTCPLHWQIETSASSAGHRGTVVVEHHHTQTLQAWYHNYSRKLRTCCHPAEFVRPKARLGILPTSSWGWSLGQTCPHRK